MGWYRSLIITIRRYSHHHCNWPRWHNCHDLHCSGDWPIRKPVRCDIYHSYDWPVWQPSRCDLHSSHEWPSQQPSSGYLHSARRGCFWWLSYGWWHLAVAIRCDLHHSRVWSADRHFFNTVLCVFYGGILRNRSRKSRSTDCHRL